MLHFIIFYNLQDGRSGRTVLHYATENGDLELMAFFIRICRANVNVGTFDGSTALKLACGHQNQGAINLLIAAGAEPYISSEESDSESEDEVGVHTLS